MIATWMVYCVLCAAGLTAAAALAERALLAGRGPVRAVWVSAVVLSFLIPLAAFEWPRPMAQVRPSAIVTHDRTPVSPPQAMTPIDPSRRPPQPSVPAAESDWRATLARFDRGLAFAWMFLSIAVAISFVGGAVALAWMRQRWQRRTVLGVSVLISQRTGPAVVGVVSPEIVLPEWVLAMAPPKLALMLRHEEEHRRARDGQLLAAALLTLIAMPWNLALWWQVLRLRVAVELDCDARVLRAVADPRMYGDLLLEVARPQRGLIGSMAFAARAMQLERRIRVLGRHRVRTSRAARVAATSIGLAAVSVAWVAPRPAVPVRNPVQPVATVPAPRSSTPTIAAPAAAPAPATTAQQTTIIKPAVTAVPRADSTRRRALAAATPAIVDSSQPPKPTAPALCGQPGLVDTAFDRLFDGISLTPDQRATACGLLTALRQDTTRQEVRGIFSASERAALVAARDSALRALVTNDGDRATLDARLSRSGRGGARGAGRGDMAQRRLGDVSPPDSAMGRGRGTGRGQRGAVPSAPPDSARLVALSQTRNDATFRSLFSGIALTAAEEEKARALIATAQRRVQEAQTRPRPSLQVDSASGRVLMPAQADSALTALIANEADRSLVQSRIVAIRAPR